MYLVKCIENKDSTLAPEVRSTNFVHIFRNFSPHRSVRELDIAAEAKGSGADPLAVGPLSLNVGGIDVEVGPVVGGGADVGQRLGGPLVRLGWHGRHGGGGGCVFSLGDLKRRVRSHEGNRDRTYIRNAGPFRLTIRKLKKVRHSAAITAPFQSHFGIMETRDRAQTKNQKEKPSQKLK